MATPATEASKQQADALNISYHPNISDSLLKERIREAEELKGKSNEPSITGSEVKLSLREHMQREQMKLVRIQVSCLNPSKANLRGEFITVDNPYLGTVTKFIPYGEGSENGYHVPYCIYEIMKDKQYLQVRTVKGRDGRERTETSLVNEYAIRELPPLTKKELDALSVAQKAAEQLEGSED